MVKLVKIILFSTIFCILSSSAICQCQIQKKNCKYSFKKIKRATCDNRLKGDMNGDKLVNRRDLKLLRRAIRKKKQYAKKFCISSKVSGDLNGDNRVSKVDLTLLKDRFLYPEKPKKVKKIYDGATYPINNMKIKASADGRYLVAYDYQFSSDAYHTLNGKLELISGAVPDGIMLFDTYTSSHLLIKLPRKYKKNTLSAGFDLSYRALDISSSGEYLLIQVVKSKNSQKSHELIRYNLRTADYVLLNNSSFSDLSNDIPIGALSGNGSKIALFDKSNQKIKLVDFKSKRTSSILGNICRVDHSFGKYYKEFDLSDDASKLIFRVLLKSEKECPRVLRREFDLFNTVFYDIPNKTAMNIPSTDNSYDTNNYVLSNDGSKFAYNGRKIFNYTTKNLKNMSKPLGTLRFGMNGEGTHPMSLSTNTYAWGNQLYNFKTTNYSLIDQSYISEFAEDKDYFSISNAYVSQNSLLFFQNRYKNARGSFDLFVSGSPST